MEMKEWLQQHQVIICVKSLLLGQQRQLLSQMIVFAPSGALFIAHSTSLDRFPRVSWDLT